MASNILKFEGLDTAEKLVKINRELLHKETISGFGMKNKVSALVDILRSAMFPNIYDTQVVKPEKMPEVVAERLERAAILLDCMIAEVLVNQCELKTKNTAECGACKEEAAKLTVEFIEKLPEVTELLHTDIDAAYDGDPAVVIKEEIPLAYPGFDAIGIYRMAHELCHMDVPLLPRMMTELAHSRTGIDIHPGAHIGKHFFIDHGTGVVIGETCTIGEYVKIYQGVTLGAKSFELDENGNPVKGIKRHPDIEDRVIIYSGATILGGDTRVGHDSVIGGNVWLTESVQPYSTVYNATPAPVIKGNGKKS